MKSPRERAKRVIVWCRAMTDMGQWDESVLADVEERICEEIADAQDELREGFLRKPTHRPTINHAPVNAFRFSE